MRALRPGGHTLQLLQSALMSFAARTVCDDVPFWRMLSVPVESIRARAHALVEAAGRGSVTDAVALIGAGSAPGTSVPSVAVTVDGDVTARLRALPVPVVARVDRNVTLLDLRTVDPADDHTVAGALRAL
jgi:L-seryl-tRNA(Ser) seleniumtransferase